MVGGPEKRLGLCVCPDPYTSSDTFRNGRNEKAGASSLVVGRSLFSDEVVESGSDRCEKPLTARRWGGWLEAKEDEEGLRE
jgi:hypothetical protein